MELTRLLQQQRELQVKSFGADPLEMEGEERTDFIRWNALAIDDEVHEMLGEVGWKPWASSRHVNEKEATSELVDALHFFLNLCLATAPRGWSVEMVAHTIASGYASKRAENARRQAEGYDGVSGKCKVCKRDLGEIEPVLLPYEGETVECCPCGAPIDWEA
jgi:hypothetical protein